MANKCKQCGMLCTYFESEALDGFCSELCMDRYFTEGKGIQDEQNAREMQFEEAQDEKA